jgi:hypothetical protein
VHRLPRLLARHHLVISTYGVWLAYQRMGVRRGCVNAAPDVTAA